MINWNEHLFIHDNIKENMEDVIKDIHNKKYADVYCIIRSLSKNNLFEILSLAEMSNGLYKNFQMQVYGIAKGKSNIKDVLVDIVESIVDEDGNININNI